MGDLAANIAERAIYLANHDPLQTFLNFNQMADKVRTMVRKSLDALIRMDTKLARSVLSIDDEINDLNREMYNFAKSNAKKFRLYRKSGQHTFSLSLYGENRRLINKYCTRCCILGRR